LDSRKPSLPNKKTIRLQKYLAECGVGSRRACERVIGQGRVAVDGRTIREQGVRIDPEGQRVEVDGRPVRPQPLCYILLNKPRDVLCTSSDEKGRRTIHDLLPDSGIRVYNVGRLDRDSEGLLLVTNDGELAATLMHPRYHISKTYRVWIDRLLTTHELKRFEAGITCQGELLTMQSIREIGEQNGRFEYEIVLAEGKNRQIRRMLEACEVRIYRLRRIRMGPLTLEGVPTGGWRYLSDAEKDAVCALK
jgi:pseudouridine synthase